MTDTPTDLPARVEEAHMRLRDARRRGDPMAQEATLFEALAADWQRVTKELESERGLHACAKAFHDVAVAERDLARYQVERLRERERVLTEALRELMRHGVSGAELRLMCSVGAAGALTDTENGRAILKQCEALTEAIKAARAALPPEPKT